MSALYQLYERCHKYLAPPMNFDGAYALDDARIYEALGPLYECLNIDDTLEGFVKWIMIPLIVAFGEEEALTPAGKELASTQNLAFRLEVISKSFSAEKKVYLESKKIADIEDKWEFINFSNRDLANVGKAFLHALKYKKIPK
jgi:hypothetical protein